MAIFLKKYGKESRSTGDAETLYYTSGERGATEARRQASFLGSYLKGNDRRKRAKSTQRLSMDRSPGCAEKKSIDSIYYQMDTDSELRAHYFYGDKHEQR